MSTGINIGKAIKILDEGSTLTSDVAQINFTGTGVTATTSGNNVTVNIPPGGLTYFTEAQNTSVPNATTPVDSLTAVSAATNADFAIIPKGNGAIIADIPDGVVTGGNKRGTYAVDFQMLRLTNAAVASGNFSVISGGEYNTASNSHASVGGGYQNTASGDKSRVGGGNQNTASSDFSTVGGGANNSASGSRSTIAGGASNTATGYSASTLGGFGNGSTNNYASNLGGVSNSSSGEYSSVVGGANNVASGRFSWKTIIAKQTATTNVAAWDIDGLLVRGANAAATTLLVSNVTLVSNLPLFGTPMLTADTTSGGLRIQIMGLLATNIQWVANIQTTEVIY